MTDSLAFLERLRPEGPWLIICMVPDGRIHAKVFDNHQKIEMEHFIEYNKNVGGIHISVNKTFKGISKKATKRDIETIEYLYVDVDPDSDTEATPKAIEEFKVKKINEVKNFDKPPTFIVDSGSGLHFYWRLCPSQVLQVNGDLQKIEEIEKYNMWLSDYFGGDKCFNADRTLRLPGTINYPNKTKIKKGRKVCNCVLVEYNDISYPIESFEKKFVVKQQVGSSVGDDYYNSLDIGDYVEYSAESLKDWATHNNKILSQEVFELIKDPLKDGRGRSENVLRLVCLLIRAEIKSDVIYGLLMGNERISDHIKDQANPQKYCLRQIERAKQYIISPELLNMNEKYCVISSYGGKCVVLCEPENSEGVQIQSFESFKNRLCNKYIESVKDGKSIKTPLGNWWLLHPMRRQYDSIVFSPKKEIPQCYNLWKGFNYIPEKGNKHEIFLNFIFEVICKKDLENYKYIIGWFARMIQYPDVPGEVAIVLIGSRGTGKSKVLETIGNLLGRHYMSVSAPEHITGNFNSHLREIVLLNCEEAFFSGSKRHDSVLKTLITSPKLNIEKKGYDITSCKNLLHIAVTSNENWVVPAGVDERRYFVLKTGEQRKQDYKFFSDLDLQMQSGGFSNLLHYFLSYDLSDYQVRKVPQTTPLEEQKINTLNPEGLWLLNMLCDAEIDGFYTWGQNVPRTVLYNSYIDFTSRSGTKSKRLGKILLYKFIMDNLSIESEDIAYSYHGNQRLWCFNLPNINDARLRWQRNNFKLEFDCSAGEESKHIMEESKDIMEESKDIMEEIKY